MELKDSVSNLPSVGNVYARRLEKLGIYSLKDLLFHIPHRYKDFSLITNIANIEEGKVVTVSGTIENISNIYTRGGKKIQIANISDKTGKLQVIWFNQPFLTRTLKKKMKVHLSGKVDTFNEIQSLVSPEYEVQKGNSPIHTCRLVPIYPETMGLSSRWLRSKIYILLNTNLIEIDDHLSNVIKNKFKLIGLKRALNDIHFPKTEDDVKPARTRLAIDELIPIHIKNDLKKTTWGKNKVTHKLTVDKNANKSFIDSLPFKLTQSQNKTIQEIFKDLKGSVPMNRLLEGDVGSGKTVVAAAASFVAITNGYQAVFMAPTQILAEQHYQTLTKIYKRFKIRVSLITSKVYKKDIGRNDMFIGTHALIHKSVNFDKVALVVIDEQHRFGVEQRSHLIKRSGNKKSAPHVLTMTATPIPRTIALTLYGDLELSTLKELPKGRIPIVTKIVSPNKRDDAYKWIKVRINKYGEQVFVVCPIIEESESEVMKQVKAAKVEFEKLKKIFPENRLRLLHGKLGVKEKDKAIEHFRNQKCDILVTTPVVEVGIDIPNATIMIIEAAERFGLAQLHQLRGRVGRGSKKSYCLLFTNTRSKNVNTRLNALQKTLSGFELAELDLKLRGPGEIIGTKQHGFTELKIASWNDSILIKKSKEVADEILRDKKYMSKYAKYLGLNDVLPN